jgi:putative serine protease PepD
MTHSTGGIGRPTGPQHWSVADAMPPQTGLEAPPTPAPRLQTDPTTAPERSVPPARTGRRRGRTAWVIVAATAFGGAAGTAGALLVAPATPSAPTVLQQIQGGSSGIPSATTDAEASAQRILRSVVQVRTASGSGSGFVIDGGGHVLTNHHVVEGSSSVDLVLPDGSDVSGRVLGSDQPSDIAVIEASGLATPAVDLGVSSDLRIGQQVIAVGSPLGLNGTVTSGIVSALDRTSQRSSQPLLQTDASINPGNSGGPLVDMRGRVVGVNSSIATLGYGSGNIGIGFAIPIDDAARIATSIING